MKQDKLLIVSILLLAILIVNSIVYFAYAPETPPSGVDNEVSMRVIYDPDCDECFDALQYQPEMARLGIPISEVEEIDRDSFTGKRLIKKYGLERVPTVIFSEELGTYEQIADAWDRVGTVAKDGSYILEGTNPPFLDLDSGKVRGYVNITYLDVADCDECYDPGMHKQVLEQYGMIFSDERTLDVTSTEGAALVARYGITNAPTILLRGDMAMYPAFDQVWATVGTVAEDGTAVFTKLDSLGQPFKNLETGDIVTPQQ